MPVLPDIFLQKSFGRNSGPPEGGTACCTGQGLAELIQTRRQGGEIRILLEKGVSKASIARITGVSATHLQHFIQTRKLAPEEDGEIKEP